MALNEFLSTRDPLLNFRWKIKSFPMPLDFRYVEKVSIPWERYEAVPVYWAGKNNYFPSTFDIDSINISFYEDASLTVSKTLAKWRSLIQDKGFYGLPKDYKKNIEIDLLEHASEEPVATFTAVGAWPSSIDNYDFAYDSSDRIIIAVTFNLDQGILTYKSEELNTLDPISSEFPLPSLEDMLEGNYAGEEFIDNDNNNYSWIFNSSNSSGSQISTEKKPTEENGYTHDSNFVSYRYEPDISPEIIPNQMVNDKNSYPIKNTSNSSPKTTLDKPYYDGVFNQYPNTSNYNTQESPFSFASKGKKVILGPVSDPLLDTEFI